ncbi:hypothetical protein LKL35_37230 [Streptomyces sp. ET3-23]|uniref:hypothetical protein n=1 Tax=Streptomyces sp. ET3-23 TaxID=2885643 RepID=UPI001D1090B1|nr:hypothetical protein [Streptomyces sp. ET3-23]MCC2280958.1 hypothetical protein [Streptomyces sp. ET3-23]
MGVTDRTVRRLRMDDAQFNTAVVTALATPKPKRAAPLCSTPRCDKPQSARGLCITHYGADWRKRQKGVGPEERARRADEALRVAEHVKRAILEALRSGNSLDKAYRQTGVNRGRVCRLRAQDPQFDKAVAQALSAKKAKPLEREQPSTADSGTSPLRPAATTSHQPPGRCEVDDCPNTKIKAKGLCPRHYYQQYRTGRTTPGPQTYGRTACTVPGCGRPHRAKGYCTRCYERHVRKRRHARNGN